MYSCSNRLAAQIADVSEGIVSVILKCNLQLQQFLQFVPVIGSRELEGKAAKLRVGFGDDQ